MRVCTTTLLAVVFPVRSATEVACARRLFLLHGRATGTAAGLVSTTTSVCGDQHAVFCRAPVMRMPGADVSAPVAAGSREQTAVPALHHVCNCSTHGVGNFEHRDLRQACSSRAQVINRGKYFAFVCTTKRAPHSLTLHTSCAVYECSQYCVR